MAVIILESKSQQLIRETINILKQQDYLISQQTNLRHCCFDIAARKKNLAFLFKILVDIDNFEQTQANELKLFSKILSTTPIIIGEKTRQGIIEDGIVYQRFRIPAINIRTLQYIIKKGLFPLVYAKRGGYYVKLDHELLRKIREINRLSLKEIADQLGVTRKTVYEYERGRMDSTLATATKLEEIFDMPLTVPIDIFRWEIGELSESQASFKNKFHMFVDKLLTHLGLKTVSTKRAPFNILAFYKPFIVLTSLEEPTEKNFDEKLDIVKSISKVMDSYSLLVVNKKKTVEEVEGIPVISKSELQKIKKIDGLLEIIEESN
ncbi:MAG: transcriptional regulator [Candidatus Odinarchaeia archaeon]